MEKAVAFTGQAALNKIMQKRGGAMRKANAIPGGAAMPLDRAKNETASLNGLTLRTTCHPYDGNESAAGQSGTSIFDPVLCELAYRWFCPPNGLILDPFAGGSVRGIVAAKLGRRYVGIELRAEQVEANRKQAEAIGEDAAAEELGDTVQVKVSAKMARIKFNGCDPDYIAAEMIRENYAKLRDNDQIKKGQSLGDGQAPAWIEPVWHCGDSREIDRWCADVRADFLFSCPPYADLEVYSDDPADLSTLDYEAFRAAYQGIIAKTCALLKPDRFACFVVGDVRDKKGFYYGFPWHTIAAFEAAGLRLYNEAVLVTAVGSLPIRAGRAFESARKLGKTHQNVLIFCKGDPKQATAAIGPVEFGAFQEEEEE